MCCKEQEKCPSFSPSRCCDEVRYSTPVTHSPLGMSEDNRYYGKELAERPRATVQAALDPARLPDRPFNQGELKHLSTSATRNGTVAAMATAAVSGAAVIASHVRSPRFRNSLGISGKAALVVTPSFGAFVLKSHLTLADASRDPDGFVAGTPAQPSPSESPRQSSLAAWQSAANAVYTHPFKTIIGVAGPIYGYIFYRESVGAQTASMPLSQRLIHTRVYGQMVAVLSTVAVMGFAETMKADGGIYRIEDERVVRGDNSSLRALRHWYSHEAPRRGADGRASKELETEPKQDGDGFDLLVPLLYAPLLPLMRILGRGRVAPERLNLMMGGTIGLALSHAGYIMFSDSTVLVKQEER